MTAAALKALGEQLRAAGLTPRALATWAGTPRLSALDLVLRRPRAETPASAALDLFVAGAELPATRVGPLAGCTLGALAAAGLVEIGGDRVRATCAILPLGGALVVCDRRDEPVTDHLVCWPDDSSYHLAACVPAGRVDRWRDLACGSAFAQLARPAAAVHRLATDLNPRAVAYASTGAALSGIAIEAAAADIGEPHAAVELVTCNAPMPGVGDPAIWRRAGDDFFARLWPAIPAQLAPGGTAIVHAMRRAIPDDLPGERTIVRYSPEFAVLRWRPDAPARVVERERSLTDDHPHLTSDDLV